MMYCEKLFAELNRLAVSPEGEKQLVRELASRVAEFARSPRMASIKKRWRDVIAMRKPDRPPVWFHGNAAWDEIMPPDELVCQDPVCRELEVYFKRILVKDVIGDDTPVNDYYMFNTFFKVTPENTWGVDIRHESLGADGSAWRYQPALAEVSDFDKLVVPNYKIDWEKTESHKRHLQDILGDTMQVLSSPITGYNSIGTICSPAGHLRGMEMMMMDMIETPELVHRLINTILQGQMNRLDVIEKDNVPIIPNADTPMLFSEPVNPANKGAFTLKDCWIHGNSQEFDLVSPGMFEEFLLNYQKKLFARFGAVCYGCCENLTHKLDMVLSIPNLKILTCSAWTDMPTLVQKAGDRCCIMWRHKASDVVCPDDLADFKKKIFSQADILRGCSYQVVLRELQTLFGHPARLSEWTRISIEAVSR